VIRKQDIARFQVAVDDAFLVRGIERAADLLRVPQRFIEGKRAFERPSLNEFHHQIIRPDVVEVADVRMIERGDGTGLALEAFAEPRARSLDGDAAPQSRILRPVDLAHASPADQSFDPIRAQPPSRRQSARAGLGKQVGRRLAE